MLKLYLLHYNSIRRLRNCWKSLFSLLLLSAQVESSVYYISPSPNDGWCPDVNSCYNLSEITTLDIAELNMSLILRPGNHHLVSNFTLTRLAHFSMKSEDHHLPVMINCGVSSRLQFNSTTHVHIQGLTFHRCLENEVTSVDKFIIEDSTFLGTNSSVYYSRGLVVTRSTLIITRSSFTSFQVSTMVTGKQNGGAIYCSQSNVLISHSMFMDNDAHKGGTVYCYDCTILIYNSSFTKNSAQRGGVIYNKQSNAGKAIVAVDPVFQEYLTQRMYSNDNNLVEAVLCTMAQISLEILPHLQEVSYFLKLVMAVVSCL